MVLYKGTSISGEVYLIYDFILGPELIIPSGIYCYDDYSCGFHEYLYNWEGKIRGAICWYTEEVCLYQDGFCLLWDAVKECTIKWD